MKTIKLIINIILGFGCFLMFSESDNFLPNLIGLACAILLVVVNASDDAFEQLKSK